MDPAHQGQQVVKKHLHQPEPLQENQLLNVKIWPSSLKHAGIEIRGAVCLLQSNDVSVQMDPQRVRSHASLADAKHCEKCFIAHPPVLPASGLCVWDACFPFTVVCKTAG